jgi:hypothetical protein
MKAFQDGVNQAFSSSIFILKHGLSRVSSLAVLTRNLGNKGECVRDGEFLFIAHMTSHSSTISISTAQDKRKSSSVQYGCGILFLLQGNLTGRKDTEAAVKEIPFYSRLT